MELADSDTNATPVVKTKGIGEYISSHLRQYGLLFALIAVMAFFEVVTDGTLLRAVNITNLLLQNSYIIIMALGMLIVIVSGNIYQEASPSGGRSRRYLLLPGPPWRVCPT